MSIRTNATAACGFALMFLSAASAQTPPAQTPPPAAQAVPPPQPSAPAAVPSRDVAASSSLMAAPVVVPVNATPMEAQTLRSMSMFAIQPPEPRTFAVHDLVQIIVRETSQATSSQGLETEKTYELDATVPDYKDFLSMLTMGIANGDGEASPQIQFEFDKDFEGEGDYERTDDMTARLTAEVMEILPNGNLILEASSSIRTDEEITVITVTGICRPDDVTPVNTILSNQIHDLQIEKMNSGEVKKAGSKGIISKVLDLIFGF